MCLGSLSREARGADCHAGNAWLCAYYERQGFELQARIEQQKGYEGCLYQRSVLTS